MGLRYIKKNKPVKQEKHGTHIFKWCTALKDKIRSKD